MSTITVTRTDAKRARGRLETLRQDNVEIDSNVRRAWDELCAYFSAEPAAHSVNLDAEIWHPIIAATGDIIAANL